MKFNKLPKINEKNILRCIKESQINPLSRYSKIKKLSITSERINGAFFHLNNIRSEVPSNIVRFLIRAFLMEVNAISDTLKTDLRDNKIKGKELKLHETDNPLHIFMDLLRQINIHSIPNITTGYGLSFLMKSGKEISHKPFLIGDLNLDKIKLANNSKHYSDKDLIQSIKWFNSSPQIVVGIKAIFYCGLCQYIEELILKYHL
jgi:hypothetical protein